MVTRKSYIFIKTSLITIVLTHLIVTIGMSQTPVDWTSLSDGIVESGEYPYEIFKESPYPEWLGARSDFGLEAGESGWIMYTAVESRSGYKDKAFGFSSSATGLVFANLDFGVFINQYQDVYFVVNGELGEVIGSYEAGDVFMIAKVVDTLRIFINGDFLEGSEVVLSSQNQFYTLCLLHSENAAFRDMISSFHEDGFYAVNWDSDYNYRTSTVSPGVTKKTVSGGGWCAGSESVNLSKARDLDEDSELDPDWLKLNVTTTSVHKIIGFSSEHGACYGSVEYGLYLNASGTLHSIRLGTQVSLGYTYSVNDEIKIEMDRENLVFRYFKNGTQIGTLAMNSADQKKTFFIDALIYNDGGELKYLTSSFVNDDYPFALLKSRNDGNYYEVTGAPGYGALRFIVNSKYRHSGNLLNYRIYDNSGSLVAYSTDQGSSANSKQVNMKKGSNKVSIPISKLGLAYDNIYVLVVDFPHGERKYLRFKNKVPQFIGI